MVAWGRVLNMQTGIGPTTAQTIIERVKNITADEINSIGEMLPARAQTGWNNFLSIHHKLMSGEKIPVDLISSLLDSKYLEYLESQHEDYRERKEDIEQLIVFAEKENDLTKFLAEASLQEGYSATRLNVGGESKIILSTIHQAKGLEWEAVFVINLSAGQFPNERATRERNGLEEERRLFYVAITRAKKHLHLSYPLLGGVSSYLQGPSMFLDEIDRSLLNEDVSSGSLTAFDDLSDGEVTYEKIETKPVREFLKSLDEL